jgi:ribosomal protein S3
VREVPGWQGDGNGGQGVRRLGGRPTTLTHELSAEIVTPVEEVGALATAARCAGVPVRVARRLLREPHWRTAMARTVAGLMAESVTAIGIHRSVAGFC